MKQAIVGGILLGLVMASVADADEVAANACAASLPPQARLVFDAVRGNPQSADPLRKVLALRVGELVFGGRLPLSAARSAAEAASECLRIARDCTADIC